ncbi:MAG: YadA-like family protein [Haemophilus parainfluenzae]|nr:YadA-like family protein [Haemophilus parainfluenzae]MDU4784076.1 YadA-like family protein [Haemophilus parainfluenzae]MDU7654832.1 YadA-like family protein [Haemophilus parainfluenzae]
MKNFKFNAITALIIGVNVAVANATDGNILNITTQDAVNANKRIEATNVKGPGHTAIGQQNQIYSIPAAEAEESQGSSSAIGNQNVVKGEQANAIGDGNDAYGHFTQSVGDDNKVYADHSLGYGAHNKVGAQRAKGTPEKDVVVDKNTSKASVFGLNNVVLGKEVLALGNNNNVNGENSTAIGTQSTADGINTLAIGTGAKAHVTNPAAANSNKPGNLVAIGTSAEATAAETVAIGQAAKASGQNSNAYGSQANASGTSSLAVGTGSVASGDSAVAIGNDSTVTGGSAVAIGASATSTGKWSTALGDSANAKGEKSVALSKDSYAKDDNSVALGSGTITRSATQENTATVNGITYNGFAGNTPVAVVSVGSDKTETYTPPDHSTPGRTVTITPHTRQIINVGAGEISATSTDAINGSQLYMVADQVGKNKTRIDNIRMRTSDVKVKAGDNIDVKEVYDDANQVKTYTVSTTKDIKANSYTINNSNIKIDQNGINAGNKKVINVANGENDNDAVNVSQLNKVKTDVANNTKNIATNTQNIANNTKAINTLNKKVNDVDRKSRAGIAGVAAIASAPSARKDGKSMVSTGVAHHRGESAIAIKASRNSDNGHWSTNVNGAADTRGQFTVGAGVGYEW